MCTPSDERTRTMSRSRLVCARSQSACSELQPRFHRTLPCEHHCQTSHRTGNDRLNAIDWRRSLPSFRDRTRRKPSIPFGYSVFRKRPFVISSLSTIHRISSSPSLTLPSDSRTHATTSRQRHATCAHSFVLVSGISTTVTNICSTSKTAVPNQSFDR